jgi:thymidylate synthase (FAD)
MKLIKPYTEILTPINGLEILQTIEKVARTCYKSEDKITEGSAEKMIQMLISRGHEAMIEFFDITVKFVCDRGVSHELVRHRIASFAQESTRYCNYSNSKFEEQITYIIPFWLYDNDLLINKRIDKSNYHTFVHNESNELSYLWALLECEQRYLQLISGGWQPQQARSVLPNSLKTEINIKMNLREWRHFFKLRTALAAHPQMRELTIPLLKELQSKIPIIFDDIKYENN